MTAECAGGASRQGQPKGSPNKAGEGDLSDPYAFIDAQIQRPSGNQQQRTEQLERQLEQLQLTIHKKIDGCFEAAEEKAASLANSLPQALASVQTLAGEVTHCHCAAERLLACLEATGGHQEESLGPLYVLQAVKKHLEGCSKIVAELHRWHFRIQEAELLLQSLRPNCLLEASQQRAVVEAAAVAASLRHAASLLASLPEFESRLHAAKKLEQRVLYLATLLLQDSVSANSTEGFACAVSAFESLGAQEVLLQELPAALRSLLLKVWKRLWAQTPAGQAEEVEGEGQLLPGEDGSLPAEQPRPYHPSMRCVAEPEALMAYAEQWAAAVEQATGFIRAAAASVGGARRHAASEAGGEEPGSGQLVAAKKAPSRRGSTDSHHQPGDPHRPLPAGRAAATGPLAPQRLGKERCVCFVAACIFAEGEGSSRSKIQHLWVSLLLASMGAGADVPIEALERLLQRYLQQQQQQQQQFHQHQQQQQQYFEDGFELSEQLLAAFDVAATLISAIPAFAETETADRHLWERFCHSVDFLPPSLLAVYGAAVTRRLSAPLESLPRASSKKVTPAQASRPRRTQMEAETHLAVEQLLETLPSLSDSGSNPAAAPFILAAADAALVETLNALSPRINTFQQTVAIKSQNLLLQQRDRLSGAAFDRLAWEPSLFAACLQLHSLMASIASKLLEIGDALRQQFLPVTGRPSKLSVCMETLMSRPGYFLEAPSAAAVLASQEALWGHLGPLPAEDLLPQSFSTHAALMDASLDLVVSCCCTPIELFLKSCYTEAVAAAIAAAGSNRDGNTSSSSRNGNTSSTSSNGFSGISQGSLDSRSPPSSPTAAITAVGEHVLSLLPLLEDATPPADQELSWVILLLQGVAKCYFRVLLACMQQDEEEAGAVAPHSPSGTPGSPLGFTDKTPGRQLAGGEERSQQSSQPKAPPSVPCVLSDLGLQVLLNDLFCLERLAETLGVIEDGSPQVTGGLLGFVFVRAAVQRLLKQPESAEGAQPLEADGPECVSVGRSSAAVALAADVVKTAESFFREKQRTQT
ncbi:hypothetical protein Efla_001396 [Eimeria flavescens]